MDQRAEPSSKLPALTAHEPDLEGRDLRLDLFRGIALWFILLDHIPKNPFAWATLRNYGFSDTTEIFFFVSGYTCALAYGHAQREFGWRVAATRILRRALEIYAGFLLLVIVFLAIIAAVTTLDKQTLDSTNTAVLFNNPGEGVLHLVTLTWMPVNTDVLTTFALLHALFLPLLVLLNRSPNTALLLSIALYVCTRAFDWNIPTWPPKDDGFWAFNPFAFQVLFVFGAWIAFGGKGIARRVASSRIVLAVSVLYLAVSAFIVVGWQSQLYKVEFPELVSAIIYPVDKQALHPLRVLHFLALAIVAYRFIPYGWERLTSWPARAAIWCGENSLAIYSLGVILSFLAEQILNRLGQSVPLHTALSIAGIAISIAVAYALTRAAQLDKREPKLL